MRVLVTGGGGFVGRHVVAELQRREIEVRLLCRQGTKPSFSSDDLDIVYLSGSGAIASDWADVVAECSVVIHLAARAHIWRDLLEDPALSFQSVNVDFTRACGEAAVIAGVQRFIFMSSIGVHGGASGLYPIQAESAVSPHTPYARSKANAERELYEISQKSNMELTVLRPPLVYGPGAPGNFGILVRAINRGWPMPLGRVTENLRSFVAIDNLVNLILTCIFHPAAANQAFLVSDGEDLSTAELICRLGAAMGRPVRLLPVPVNLIALVSRVLGKRDMFQSLCGTLQVDISKTRDILGWEPTVSVDEGLRRAISQRM